MAASQGRLAGLRGLHSARCLLRSTAITTAKSTGTKGIDTKVFKRTIRTSIPLQGKEKHKIRAL